MLITQKKEKKERRKKKEEKKFMEMNNQQMECQQTRCQGLKRIGLVAVIILSVLSCLLGFSNMRAKNFGLVDMQILLQEQSQMLAKAYPNGRVPQAIMHQVVEEIKTIIKDFGQDQKITLLAKGVVLSEDLPDYTEVLKEISNEKLQISLKTECTKR